MQAIALKFIGLLLAVTAAAQNGTLVLSLAGANDGSCTYGRKVRHEVCINGENYYAFF